MRLATTERFDSTWVAGVVLSRRNLLSLLAKLDGHPPESFCTIVKDGFFVKAEEDDLHYAERGYPPGLMHEATERAMR